jgi:hypothetical protein
VWLRRLGFVARRPRESDSASFFLRRDRCSLWSRGVGFPESLSLSGVRFSGSFLMIRTEEHASESGRPDIIPAMGRKDMMFSPQ